MSPKPVWVLDTNVVVSGLLHPDRAAGQLLSQAVAGHFLPAYDARILAEYHEVLGRRKFGLPAAAVAQFIDGFIAYGVLIAPHPILVGLPDPDDEIFYAVARQCSSQILVTGNARHFPVAMIRPVKALSIRDALALL